MFAVHPNMLSKCTIAFLPFDLPGDEAKGEKYKSYLYFIYTWYLTCVVNNFFLLSYLVFIVIIYIYIYIPTTK